MFENPLKATAGSRKCQRCQSVLVLILFARYRTAEILSLTKIWRPFLLLVCIPLVLLSGKRAAAACLVLYPIIAAVCRKEFRYVFLVRFRADNSRRVGWRAGYVCSTCLSPPSALSPGCPADGTSRLAFMEGGKDEFRAKLRDSAEEKIRKDPWIGRGYDVNLTATQRLMLTMGNKFDALI